MGHADDSIEMLISAEHRKAMLERERRDPGVIVGDGRPDRRTV
jgi:hypothetical protein